MVHDIKIGDYLYCHTDLIMEDNFQVCANAGHRYLVIDIKNENRLVIRNNQQLEHNFSFREDKHHYYKKWFCDLNFERRLKLKKISTL